ncbi:MAG: hypothetical protein WA634_14390 [Silvibacterium sp.]
MPVLNSQDPQTDPQTGPQLASQASSGPEPSPARRIARAFPACANPRCASGWLQLWRKRRVPVVEGGWLCSPACTRARVEDLLRREYAEARPVPPHRHRVPIGLVLLAQGWITHEHLKQALQAQRNGSGMRLGEWLVAHRGLDEARLTQALGLQWSCPVFSLEKHGSGLPVTVIPRLLPESFGFVPLRLTSSGMLYLAFEDRIDHSLALAIERMTGLRVESGLLSASEFAEARQRLAAGRFAPARMIEAASLDLLAEAFTRLIEKEKPVEARLVRVQDLLWLRLWRQGEGASPHHGQAHGGEDVIGAVTQFTQFTPEPR